MPYLRTGGACSPMKQIRNSYRHTIYASYIGYITQAIINGFVPLLFLTFQSEFGLSLDRIGLLVTVNFSTQLIVDLLAAKYIDRIGYRKAIVAAHLFCAAGLCLLAILPSLLSSPFLGLCLSVITYAIGGGLIEVLISPIVEACPTNDKSAAMSLLHSFYCWGCVAVILLSTLLFYFVGTQYWKPIACLWAIVPLANSLYFTQVPIHTLDTGGEPLTLSALLRSKGFLLLVLFMVCAGASEQAMSQWASAFAESGLQVSKTLGDLTGPCFFAALMGISRIIHAKYGEKVSLERYLFASALLCVISYLIACLSPIPLLSLLGCGICGFSVGAMWPGVFSLAAKRCPHGGTGMFALLALAGDCGCGAGPSIVGFVSDAWNNNLKLGLLIGMAFPLLMLLGLWKLAARKTIE